MEPWTAIKNEIEIITFANGLKCKGQMKNDEMCGRGMLACIAMGVSTHDPNSSFFSLTSCISCLFPPAVRRG